MINLVVPIYSMRSHVDNKYYVMKDGNLQLHLARWKQGDFLIVPTNTADLRELYKYVPAKNIYKITYFENAYETRKRFWAYNGGLIDALAGVIGAQQIITDITGYKGALPLVNNFNISWSPIMDRPYIDEFAEMDADSIRKARRTFVLNKEQITDMQSRFPDLVSSKFKLCTEVVNPTLLDKMAEGDPITLEPLPNRPKVLFFPFRLSDKAYDWEGVQEMYYDNTIYITDPNETYDGSNPNVVVIKPTKNEYYRILKGRPAMRYNENPQKVLHPGLGELLYFNVRLSHPNTSIMPRLEDLIVKGPVWPDLF